MASRLASEMSGTQVPEFVARLGRAGITLPTAKRLMGDDDLMDRFVAAGLALSDFQLIHDRFTPLSDVLVQVKAWPGMIERFGEKGFMEAIAEFERSERKRRYEAALADHKLLQLVVVPYLDTAAVTLLYARDRYRDASGKFGQWEEAYAQGVDENRVRLLNGVPDRRNCLRIEVVDLGAHWNPKDGFIPSEIRGPNSATFAVIYAAAQNPAWVRQMDGANVPFALAGGLELNVPGYDGWAFLPSVWFDRDYGAAGLNGGLCDYRYHEHALPILWE